MNTLYEIHCGDALARLAELPNESIDAIVTDPAYWTLDKWRNMGTTARLGGASGDDALWFETIDKTDLTRLINECSRVLRKNAHAWMMCDGQTLPYLLAHAAEGDGHDFKYFKPFPVLKRSKDGNYRQGMGYHGRCCHEYVVLLEKGRRRFTEESWPDVFEAVWNGDAETRPHTANGKPFPTAKPTALFTRWIELSTIAGETVLDPFTGSGTTGIAALTLGRRFIGIEKDARNAELSRRRIEASLQTTPQLEMFA